MEAMKLEEQSLRKAIMQRPVDPLVIRMLERMIDFNKLSLNTLTLMNRFYSDQIS